MTLAVVTLQYVLAAHHPKKVPGIRTFWYGAHWGALAYRLLREQGVAGSNPVIPTSVYMRATFPGSLFLFVLRSMSGPDTLPTDNLSAQEV